MQIDDQTWVQIATGNGVTVQKLEIKKTAIFAYAAQTPTTEDVFSITDNDLVVLPAVIGMNIYVMALEGSLSLTVRETIYPYSLNANDDDAANVVAEITNISDFPENTTYQGYFFGTDDTDATVVVNVDTDGTWLDMSKISPSARSISIHNGNASPSYQYTVLFGRKLADGEAQIVVAKTASILQDQFIAIPDGYNLFCNIRIHADAGQAGTQLNFKAVLSGRGAA